MVKDKPQTTSKELQEHLAADNVIVSLHKEQLNGRVMWKKLFLGTANKQSRLRYANAYQ